MDRPSECSVPVMEDGSIQKMCLSIKLAVVLLLVSRPTVIVQSSPVSLRTLALM